MWWEIFVQGIGFVAIAMNVISAQFNTHFKVMLFKSLGSFLAAVQYFFLGAFVGMAMDLIGVVRNFVFSYNVKKSKSNKWWIIFFSTFTAIVGIVMIIFTWKATLAVLTRWTTNATWLFVLAMLVSTLSILAKVISTIGYGFKDPHLIRLINLPTFSMWIIYNFIAFSIAGMISDAMSIISIIIAEIRFREKPKKTTKTDNVSNNLEQEPLSIHNEP